MSHHLTLAQLADVELALWQRVQELWELSAAKDVTRIRDALHPDYMGWDTNSPLPHDREAAVQSASGESGSLLTYALEPLSVRVYEDSVGVVHYRYKATVAANGGQHLHVGGKWTEVYIKHGPNWLMVAVSGRPSQSEGSNGASAQAA